MNLDSTVQSNVERTRKHLFLQASTPQTLSRASIIEVGARCRCPARCLCPGVLSYRNMRNSVGPGTSILNDFFEKCLSEASSKTRAEGDEREEKKLREAELLKNASEPRRSGRSPLGSAEASLKHLACVLIVLEQSPWGLRRNVRPSSGGCPPRAKGV